MQDKVRIVLATFPDRETARSICTALVESRLAACVNLVGDIESIYRWKGEIESATECLAIFKTTADRLPEFASQLQRAHPYEVPEILALPLSQGLPEYLAWVVESCGNCGEEAP